MVHWSAYPVITALVAVFAWFSYYYLRWARAMDRINMDHFEFQKQRLWIEGISYFTGTISFHDEPWRRFPVEKEAS